MLRLLANIAVFFILIPYIVTFPTASDIQPNALVFSLLFISIFIVRNNMRLPFSYVSLIFFFIFLYSIFITFTLDSISIRGVISYASLFIFSQSGYLIVRKELFRSNIIKYAVWIWTFFGLAQMLFQREFGYFLLQRGHTSESRGVISLASEPSYYGIMCLFMIVAIDMLMVHGMFSEKSAKKYKILLILQMIFLAQSFITILLYLIYFTSGILVAGSFKRLVKAGLCSVAGLELLVFILEKNGTGGSRILYLLYVFLINPMAITSIDVSAVSRFGDIFMSIYGFYDSLPWAIGHGTTAYRDFVVEHRNMLPPSFPVEGTTNRIMSGNGAALFELGYIGTLIPLITFISFWKNGTTRMKGIGLFLVISMFSAIPLAFPLYSFLIGMSEAFRRKYPVRLFGKFHPQPVTMQ